jgi:hypothetical protein
MVLKSRRLRWIATFSLAAGDKKCTQILVDNSREAVTGKTEKINLGKCVVRMLLFSTLQVWIQWKSGISSSVLLGTVNGKLGS